MTFNEHLKSYISERLTTGNLSQSSIIGYGYAVKLLGEVSRGVLPEDLNHSHLVAYMEKLRDSYSPATRHSRVMQLKALLRWMEEKGTLAPGFASALKAPIPKGKIPKTLDTATIERLIDFCPAIRDKAMILIMWQSGLRVGEVCNLRLEDIDHDTKSVLIRASKSGKQRVVPLTERAYRMTQLYRLKHRPRKHLGGDGHLFLTTNGTPVNHHNYGHILQNGAKRAGIDAHITPHKFRHTCASNLVQRDLNIVHVKDILGHSSINTTMGYVHGSSPALRAAFDAANGKG